MKHLQRLTVKAVTHLFISVVFGLSAVTACAIGDPPTIIVQPSNTVVVVGQAASLSVTATDAIGYQWLKDGVILTGRTDSNLTFSSFQFTNSGSYNVVITNIIGLAISFPASLSVSNAPLRAWGYNNLGQLGNGANVSTNLPIVVTSNVVAVAAGEAHSLLVKADGTLWAMGCNGNGQLGNGTETDTNRPIEVTNNVVAVAAGQYHSLFVTTNGTLWAMGYGFYGQLGNGTNGAGADTNLPTYVTSNVVAVAAGWVHSLFVKADGTLWAMGRNDQGQLGLGNNTDTNRPTYVTNNVVAVAAGAYHSLFVKSDGTLWAVGRNSAGQLGIGNNTETNLPVEVTNNVVAVAAGAYYSLFVKSDGTLWAMGENSAGQLGIGTTINTNRPIQVTNNVVAIAGGNQHSLFVKSDGTLWAMGLNNFGQLGNGTTVTTNRPVLVNNGGLMTVSLAKGPITYHSLAIAVIPVTATVSPSNGPFAGGNRVVVTNASANIGNGDITNITVGGVAATAFAAHQGANWVSFLAPATGSAGAKDIVIQSTSVGATTLAGAYTVNLAGYIGTEWGETAGLPTNRYGIAAGVLSGEVYVVGGYETVSGNNAASNVYHYVGTNWVETVGLPEGRRNIAVGVCSGLLYAVGGAYGTGGSSVAKTNVYTFDGSLWTEVAGLPAARSAMSVGVLSGAVYAVGGYNGGSESNVYRFNGSSWTEVPSLPSARDTMGCGVLNDRLYIVGGFTNTTGPTSDGVTNVFMFDGSTWTEVQGLPEKRGSLTACVLGGRLYAIGGYGSTYTNSVYRFDGSNWDSVAGLPAGRARLASAAVGNQLLAIGGTDGSTGQTNVYFFPSGGVSPTFGSITGGYVVTISGGNLGNGSDITNVSLCGISTTNFTSQSTTQIIIVAAAGAPGLGNVRVYSISYGETVKSNGFTYIGPVMSILGTNGAAIASGDPASAANGTDFGTFALGAAAATNTLSITNGGNATLTITGVTTTGMQNAEFRMQNVPASIAAGTASNFSIVFNPSAAGIATASVAIANDSGVNPFMLNVKGMVSGTVTNLPTPTSVSATYGTYTNYVRVTWLGVTGATSYEILRNTTNDPNGATEMANVPASQGIRGQRSEVSNQSTVYSLESTVYYYDDYTVVGRQSYYYWVRALSGSGVSTLSYVGMGYAELGSGQTVGRSDLTVSDMVFLPVNLTNGSSAGTVSYRLANGGPDTLTAAPVRFDFYMVQSNQAAWMAYNETNLTLAVGAEQLIILAASARQWLRVRADLAGQYTVQARARHLDLMADQHTGSNMTDAAGTVLARTSGVNSPGRSWNDYDGDGKSDVAVYSYVMYRWFAALSGVRYSSWLDVVTGSADFAPVPGDYDGDGITDLAIYNRSNGWWQLVLSSTAEIVSGQFGGPDYTAAQCDFDGDAKTDPVIYREADGYWAGVASSRQYTLYEASLGVPGYQPVFGDYDGDGLADPAVYNRATGLWAIGLSGSGYELVTGLFGGTGYLPASADYDGDGLTDPAIYAPDAAYWQLLLSGSLATQGYYTLWDGVIGNINGLPVPADYDGDGKADFAIYHQDTGLWELYLSAHGQQAITGYFGGQLCPPVTE